MEILNIAHLDSKYVEQDAIGFITKSLGEAAGSQKSNGTRHIFRGEDLDVTWDSEPNQEV